MPKYTQNELMPMPHGGKREGAGRKPTEEKKAKTVVIRINEQLLPEIEKLKKGEYQKNELKEALIKQIEVIRNHRDKAEKLENKRKGDEYGQFEQILLIDAELNKLEYMIKSL